MTSSRVSGGVEHYSTGGNDEGCDVCGTPHPVLFYHRTCKCGVILRVCSSCDAEFSPEHNEARCARHAARTYPDCDCCDAKGKGMYTITCPCCDETRGSACYDCSTHLKYANISCDGCQPSDPGHNPYKCASKRATQRNNQRIYALLPKAETAYDKLIQKQFVEWLAECSEPAYQMTASDIRRTYEVARHFFAAGGRQVLEASRVLAHPDLHIVAGFIRGDS